MQRFTGSVSSESPRHGREPVSRLVRAIRSLAVAERPAMRWAEMTPIDFEGEDTSLTQEQLEVLR
ncbi:MAG TPA: hypothetical protein VLT82_02195 [Myxococcaceae bacterium]|nr:hypothetical protein [Myxococcaceae bacterium]